MFVVFFQEENDKTKHSKQKILKCQKTQETKKSQTSKPENLNHNEALEKNW